MRYTLAGMCNESGLNSTAVLPKIRKFVVDGRPAKEWANTNGASSWDRNWIYSGLWENMCGYEVRGARGGRRGKGEVSDQPTAWVAYINKGGLTSSRAIRREKGKKGKACARYRYRYPYSGVEAKNKLGKASKHQWTWSIHGRACDDACRGTWQCIKGHAIMCGMACDNVCRGMQWHVDRCDNA